MQQSPMWASLDDSQAGELYRRYAPVIFNYLRLHVSSYEDAEDLLVEVFLAAFEHGKVFDYISDTVDNYHTVLLALDIATGATRWSRPVNYEPLGFPPTVSNGMLYLIEHSPNGLSGNVLHTYRVADSSEHWARQFEIPLTGEGESTFNGDALVVVP